MSFICILQHTTDTPQSHQYLIYSLERPSTNIKYLHLNVEIFVCKILWKQDSSRQGGTRQGGVRQLRQPTLLIRDPNISDSATMCGEYYQQHSLPPPPRLSVTRQLVIRSILLSVFAPGDSVSVSGVRLMGPHLCDGAEGGRGLQLDWATFTFTCCCWHQMAARSRDGTLDAWPYITAAAAHQHRA